MISRQLIGEPDLPEIPSDYIEPYIKRYMMMQLESLHYRFITPSELRTSLKTINNFVSRFCGIHSTYATNNEFNRLCNLDDSQMISIADETFK